MNSSSLSYWGLLGPESTGSIRRTRTLELGAAVRKFNNLAVPGMGNVWYGKQIYLAALGLAVAEKGRHERNKLKNIETANAIEAIACWLSFENNQWKKDPRLKGSNKLKGTTDISFSKVRKPRFYVTQPMRMGIVQVLPSLGLVNTDSIRFNSFKLTEEGNVLVNRISEQYPEIYRRNGIIDSLILWIKESISDAALKNNDKFRMLLSPLEKLDLGSRALLKNFITNQKNINSASRCKAILSWMDMDYLLNRGHVGWKNKPVCIDEDHWADLKAGAFFFKTRKIALELLDELERNISKRNVNRISLIEANKELRKEQTDLAKAAELFLDLKYDPTPDKEATGFCRECIDNEISIRKLIERDGLGLKLKGEIVVPGPAFKGEGISNRNISEDEEDELPDSGILKLPEYISSRVQNMFYLNQDLKGNLNKWL